MRAYAHRHLEILLPGWPTTVKSCAGFAVIAAGTVLVTAIFPAGAGVAGLLVLALASGLFAAMIANLPAAVATSLVGWLFLNSFVVHQYGQLRWEGWSDGVRLLVLVGAAVTGTLLAVLTARAGRSAAPVLPRPREIPQAELVSRSSRSASTLAHPDRDRARPREGLRSPRMPRQGGG